MIIASYIFMVIGGLFLAFGGFGVFRMPDVYNRIQAGTKATTLGAFSLSLGVGLSNPGWLVKILLIIVFIALTNPVGSSTLARAAFKSGVIPFLKKEQETEAGDDHDNP